MRLDLSVDLRAGTMNWHERSERERLFLDVVPLRAPLAWRSRWRAAPWPGGRPAERHAVGGCGDAFRHRRQHAPLKETLPCPLLPSAHTPPPPAIKSKPPTPRHPTPPHATPTPSPHHPPSFSFALQALDQLLVLANLTLTPPHPPTRLIPNPPIHPPPSLAAGPGPAAGAGQPDGAAPHPQPD